MGEEDFSYDDESVPRSWQGHGKYTSVYTAVRDVGFWVEAKEYVSMNKSVCAAISMLSSDSALLSDAAIAVFKLKEEITALTVSSYPALLGDAADLAVFKAKWTARMNEHLRGQHYLALLLDPRQHVREWVASQPSLVGSIATENRGNTEAIQAALECLQKTADTDVPDDDEWVKKLVAQGMHVIHAMEKWLENQLLAYLGLHPKVQLKHLGLSDKIFRQCIQIDLPSQFFEQRVGAQCVLRRAAKRVFSCKPTSTPVERL
jgi:hypothetical protein